MWELDHKEGWVPKNWCSWTVCCWRRRLSPLDWKEIQPAYPKENQSRIFIARTYAEAEAPILLATWCKEPMHWKRPWCWERLKTGGEGDDRGQDGWMASLTRWTWVWTSSRKRWRTGRPGVLQSTGLQRVRHDWATEQQLQEIFPIQGLNPGLLHCREFLYHLSHQGSPKIVPCSIQHIHIVLYIYIIESQQGPII